MEFGSEVEARQRAKKGGINLFLPNDTQLFNRLTNSNQMVTISFYYKFKYEHNLYEL